MNVTEVKKEKKVSKFDDLRQQELDKRYKWLEMVHILLKELNTTDEVIFKKNYISCLNWMSYFYNREKLKESKKGKL